MAGVSQTGDGVRAVSTSGNGLSAFSDGSTAVFAKAKTQPGVSGISESNDGVRAVSTSGNGLSAFSSSNTGIFAKAPINAGFFEGNVTVTGELTVRGTSFSSLQQQVAALQSQLNTAISNLTGRVTQAEVAISDLKARVTALGG